ncbi:branched-chain amino acid ABC transporter permease [Comamonas flocculans]|uniref:Branched-chain amino acid ABC transporter permease n=1 Tax=Comamonas flocculans TaxID=2597701 RepID=A0A5B8RZD3_9BURK|nr:branched-chain amino acid ABC transporter permease [Comamonas flocculans]QEA14092.1 branched-chain amino acid ABC transporter permease [Comamonas flocculans]
MAAHMTGTAARRRGLIWGGFALVLLALPLVFRSSLALNMLSQIGYLIVICLSYNLLLGQGGMLSFGHAVFTGMGGYAAVVAISYVDAHGIAFPLVLMPLVGGLFGALVSVPLGYVSTRKAGTTFAMISLGIGELVVAFAIMLPDLFGGDGGISINRTYGKPLAGISFGPQIQLYYLIAAYCFVCTALMYAFTATPLGRMLNAVRDNPERAQFVGYDPQLVRWYSFIIAGFFAGVGGALGTINFEIFNAADSLSGMRSGAYLLFTFLGGVTIFFGPIIGAVLMVLATVLLSELTAAWLLYLGLIFVLMIMYAPGGVASLIMMNVQMARSGKLGRFAGLYGALVLACAVLLLGMSLLVEMIYHMQLNAAMGSEIRYLGFALDAGRSAPWLGAAAVALAGALAVHQVGRRFARAWGAAQEEIELEQQRTGQAA